MIGQAERHSRCALVVASASSQHGCACSGVRSEPILFEDMQVQEGIPGRCRLGTYVGLAREGIEAIPADAVAPLDMHERRPDHRRAKGGPGLDAQQTAMDVAMLDGLGEAHALRQAQRGRPRRPMRTGWR